MKKFAPCQSRLSNGSSWSTVVRHVSETGAFRSGPLHDASEVARFGIPTVMMFVQSLHGISHNKIEDTKEEHLELAVTAFDNLADKAIGWIER